MKAESIVFAIAGMCFGTILGWVLASPQIGTRPSSVAATEAATPASTAANGSRQAPPLDEARVQGLMTILKSDPKNVGAQVQLANTYFDAEQYPDAIKWYGESLKLDPKNVDASTDLGVSYYYTNRADEALKQFDYSLSLNPKHTKTLLNQGIVLAFGKQDLDGAARAWQKVVDMAPDSTEGQAAKRGLEGIAASRGGGAAPAAGS
jgi:tetratricopeptide (TPR) repeat protein